MASKPPPPSSPPPTPADKIAKNKLKPQLACMPGVCPETREKFYKWYPGPTIMAHTMHWTEWLYVIFVGLAILIFLLPEDSFTLLDVAICVIVVSVISEMFIWGYAKYKSLADLAKRLEKIACANHNEVGALVEINEDWGQGLEENQRNQDRFAQGLGLVAGDAEAIANLTESLANLVDVKRELQREEKQLFQITIKVEEVTRQEAREKEIGVLKQKAERLFDRIDRKNKGGGKRLDGNLENSEIDDIRELLAKDEFLNSVDEKGNALFNWLPKFEEATIDGRVAKYEVLACLEQATGAFFNTIKDALKEEAKLKEEMRVLKKSIIEE